MKDFGGAMFITDAKIYEKLLEIQEELRMLRGVEKELPIMTNPIMYTDPLGNEGSYHRVGYAIHFTAEHPPAGIDIETATLSRENGLSIAKVPAWTGNAKMGAECVLENEEVACGYFGTAKRFDTHNFVEANYYEHKITIPISGKYKIRLEGEYVKGDEISISNVKRLEVEKV